MAFHPYSSKKGRKEKPYHEKKKKEKQENTCIVLISIWILFYFYFYFLFLLLFFVIVVQRMFAHFLILYVDVLKWSFKEVGERGFFFLLAILRKKQYNKKGKRGLFSIGGLYYFLVVVLTYGFIVLMSHDNRKKNKWFKECPVQHHSAISLRSRCASAANCELGLN